MSKRVRIHVIKKGETLDKIARVYGFRSYKDIYNAGINAKFRKENPNPAIITPGSKILIPSHLDTSQGIKSKKALISRYERRIAAYEKICSDIEKSRDAQVREIRAALKKAKSTGDAVDLAATLISLTREIYKVGSKASVAMKKSGDEIAKANKEFYQQMMEFRNDYLEDAVVKPVLKPIAEKMKSSSSTAEQLGAAYFQAWVDYTSPSFWARTYVKLSESRIVRDIAKGKFEDAWAAWSRAVTWDPAKDLQVQTSKIKKSSEVQLKKFRAIISDDKKLLKQIASL